MHHYSSLLAHISKLMQNNFEFNFSLAIIVVVVDVSIGIWNWMHNVHVQHDKLYCENPWNEWKREYFMVPCNQQWQRVHVTLQTNEWRNFYEFMFRFSNDIEAILASTFDCVLCNLKIWRIADENTKFFFRFFSLFLSQFFFCQSTFLPLKAPLCRSK